MEDALKHLIPIYLDLVNTEPTDQAPQPDEPGLERLDDEQRVSKSR